MYLLLMLLLKRMSASVLCLAIVYHAVWLYNHYHCKTVRWSATEFNTDFQKQQFLFNLAIVIAVIVIAVGL